MEFRDLELVAVDPVTRIRVNPVDLADIRAGVIGWDLGAGVLRGVAAVVNRVPVYQDPGVPVGTIETEED